MHNLTAFLKDESGATAIEYGLIAAGISIAIIAVVNGLGTKLKSTFSTISTQLKYASQRLLVVAPSPA
jgi:pilus assembly protein Flp/PilA